ncbi:hypothetical protein HY78_09290 [Rhizorhabdus wittichii DC-6]|uniref:Methylamine utilization protein MauE n=1 Tax=Rhizorhabdus wittichii (strain DSM 6014 / CCUG 31198 / JCM 15750 / NBRC 105917 / EY 4224 / RW1) TaxID=392499 RepID=A0A9J9HDH6_RHIWR|nr:hypothetical protein Swit_3253 [Rhizorhabdus wittichii RW1]ARR53602.1 hypothetical protein HY78_09290 [Rhizorhabdus wittichii DC-6]
MTGIDILPVLVADVLLGGLFLLGGLAKAKDFAGFTGTLAAYMLVPEALLVPAAAAIVAVELAAGAAAIAAVAIGSQAAMGAIAALLLVYAAAMAVNIVRGRTHIDCGCLGFGTSRASLGWELVARNMLLAAVALAAAALPVAPRALGAIDAISGIGAIVAFALLYFGFGQFTAVRLQEKAVLK